MLFFNRNIFLQSLIKNFKTWHCFKTLVIIIIKYYFIVKTENEKLKKIYRVRYLKLSFIIEKKTKKNFT